MATKPTECIVRPAASLSEAHATFWPLMLSLGWQRGIADSTTHYYSTGGGEGFLLVTPAADADANISQKPEGMIVPLVYANGTGWIGFFCINEGSRGYRWGAKLFQAALDRFANTSTEIVGLDAVQEQVGTYSRRGFEAVALVDVRARPSLADLSAAKLPAVPNGKKLVALEDVPRAVLAAYDLSHTGLERTRLWSDKALFSRSDVYGFAVVDEASTAHETLDGVVLVRECTGGYRIGPLYAESEKVASVLLTTAVKRANNVGGGFNVESWRNNERAAKVFEDAGFGAPVVSYHRMWLHRKVPEAQKPGGAADRSMYAIFDAGEG